jgi:hypothetical protein
MIAFVTQWDELPGLWPVARIRLENASLTYTQVADHVSRFAVRPMVCQMTPLMISTAFSNWRFHMRGLHTNLLFNIAGSIQRKNDWLIRGKNIAFGAYGRHC